MCSAKLCPSPWLKVGVLTASSRDQLRALILIRYRNHAAARTELAHGLTNFVPTLHLGNSVTGKDILDKLEQFRSVTAASLDPADPRQEATNAAIDDMLDPAIALGSYVVDELPLGTTRAGLYIHLNAMVGSGLQ